MTNEEHVNILLVDDQPENLLALEAVIEREDFHLVKASSGAEALKYLLKYEFATILLDVQMPGMDGFETAKIIKSREKSKNIPIIFITANSMDEQHVYTGYDIGAIEYILKPFDPTTLKAKVEGFVEIYKTNRKLIQQSESLIQKTKELETAYQKLSVITSELRKSQALTNVISETSIDSMIILDQEGTVLKINPAVSTMFGHDEAEMIGNNASLLFPESGSRPRIPHTPDDVSRLKERNGENGLFELTAVRKDGSLFPAEIQIGLTHVEDKCIIVYTIRDITKKKQSQEMIAYLAYHDSLTGLPNRSLFSNRLNEILSRAKEENQSSALMYLDLDRFKYINDSLGHLIGDKLLQEIAERISRRLRDNDFIARIGGDEFNVILPETNREDALEVAEVIMESLKQPFYIEHYELIITASIGISMFPYDGEDLNSLLKSADAALYRAKEQGKNRYQIYHSGMNIQSYRTFILQNDLRKAVEREELKLLYQPRMDCKTGQINGAVALIRWNHPNWGQLLQSEFIPLAEETGQIAEIGQWFLRTACIQSKKWQLAGGHSIHLAVPFSPRLFLQKDLASTVEHILKETGLDPALLEIGVTGSAIMHDETMMLKILNELKTLGVAISIDDFGAGFVSLGYLRRIPADLVTISKTWIEDMVHYPKQSIDLLTSVLSIAHSLNLSVVTEGIDTKDELNLFQNLIPDGMQGEVFSPPVSSSEFVELVRRGLPERPASEPKPVGIDEKHDVLDFQLYRMKELFSISSRELEVFKLILDGLNNREISDKLFISEHTVKNHITHIFQKLNVNDRLQAMARVYQSCIQQYKVQ